MWRPRSGPGRRGWIPQPARSHAQSASEIRRSSLADCWRDKQTSQGDMAEEELIGVAGRIEQVLNELDQWLRAREIEADGAKDFEAAQRWRRRRWRLKAHWDGLMALISENDEP